MKSYYLREYSKLDEDAINLRIDYGFFEYSIDVFKLARFIGITLIPYSSLSKEQQSVINSMKGFEDGFTVMRCKKGEWNFFTYYNDKHSLVRQRFTVAHEIKHVLYREENPTKKDEALANHFARVLLAPSCLVMCLMENHNLLELHKLFNVSNPAIIYAVKAARARVKGRGKKLNSYEAEYIYYMKLYRKIC